MIAGDYEFEALAFLVNNWIKQGIRCCAIRATGWGDRRRAILEDLAALTGGRAITDAMGMDLKNLTADFFGKLKRAAITETRTVLTGGAGGPEAVKARADEIRKQIEAMKAEQGDPDQLRLLEQRLAGLTGGVAVIKVGGATESEMREKKDRVEDAMYATKCAAESGVVPGGGLALLLASETITGIVQTFAPTSTATFAGIPAKTFNVAEVHGLKTWAKDAGAQMVFHACSEPMRQIAQNAGKSGDAVVQKVKEHLERIRFDELLTLPVPCFPYYGYNAAKDTYEDMIAAGILDPLKAVKEEITNAVSVAMLILRADAVIAEDLEETKP